MKLKSTKKAPSGTDWDRLSNMKDMDINLDDIPELTKDFFSKAIIRLPKPKKTISLRIDSDVLEWYKQQGTRYQTRMNAVLRIFMRANTSFK